MKYFVLLTKAVGYHIEADTPAEAENTVIDMECDKDAEIRWVNIPYISIEVEEE